MATITPVWDGPTQIIGTGDGYINLSGTIESFSSNVDLTQHDAAHVRVEIDFDTSPTNNVEVYLYGSLDGISYDVVPYLPIRIDKGNDPSGISIKVEGFTHFRIGAVQTGATDTHAVRAYVRRRRWNSA